MRVPVIVCALAASMATPVAVVAETPGATTVQRHVDAYRARDMQAFLATFASDAVLVYGGMTFQGHAEIREAYSLNFAPGAPKIEVMASGSDGATIWMETSYRFANGQEICCGYSEYTIESGKITMLVVHGPN